MITLGLKFENMKDKFRLLLIVLVVGNLHLLSGQEKVNITTGIGLPEFLNIGLRFQLKQSQVGFSIGTWPLASGEKIMSGSGDFLYHFGGFSELSNRRPWFGRIGVNYLRDETEYRIDKYFYLNTRVGRDFNISKKIGITLDVGAIFQLGSETIRKKPSTGWNLDLEFPVLPSAGLGVFFRI